MSKQRQHSGSSRSSSTSPRYMSPYTFTKTGVAGEQRESMLHSELQTISEVGKPHRRGHKIPPSNFTYGLPSPRWDGGVPRALCHTPEKERAPNPDFELVRDYEALNRAAVDAGILTARDQSRFRSIHDIKRKVFIRDVSLAKDKLKLPDSMVFGVPAKPSTPIEDVLRHRFGDKWVENMQNKQANIKKEKSVVKNTCKDNYHTKTSLLRQAKIPVEPKPLWKMAKFVANSEHQVDSFRSETERRKAVSAHLSDTATRQGISQTGIYNVPRTIVQT